MTQILIVTEDTKLSASIRSKLTQKYAVEVIVKASHAEAISFMDILPDIDVVICNKLIGKYNTAEKICSYLTGKKVDDPREINVVVIGDSHPSYTPITLFSDNLNTQRLADYVGFLIGKEEKNILVEEAKAAALKIEEDKMLAIEKTKADRKALILAEAEKQKSFETKMKEAKELEARERAKSEIEIENAKNEKLKKESEKVKIPVAVKSEAEMAEMQKARAAGRAKSEAAKAELARGGKGFSITKENTKEENPKEVNVKLELELPSYELEIEPVKKKS